MSVLVSDLTNVRVGKQWNYVCFLLDLYNRETIDYNAGKHKDAVLVRRAFASVKPSLGTMKIFHTDRDVAIDELLSANNIERSLSDKGNPYGNAVSEATFEILKIELINSLHFNNLEQLEFEHFDYVHWYNNIRMHGTLGYVSPVSYRNSALKKLFDLVLTIHERQIRRRYNYFNLIVLLYKP